MKIYKSYEDVEPMLYKKITKLANGKLKKDIELFIVDSDGKWVDTISIGMRKLFCSDWILIGCDICNDLEFDTNLVKIINPEFVGMDVYKEEVKRIIKTMIEKYGLKDRNKNCYTFDDPLE